MVFAYCDKDVSSPAAPPSLNSSFPGALISAQLVLNDQEGEGDFWVILMYLTVYAQEQ